MDKTSGYEPLAGVSTTSEAANLPIAQWIEHEPSKFVIPVQLGIGSPIILIEDAGSLCNSTCGGSALVRISLINLAALL